MDRPGAELRECPCRDGGTADAASAGVESIAHFSDEELRASGIDPALIADPNYIRARAVLADADKFDATFFGLTPRDAELTDPQHRVFLETCWTALERLAL